LQPQRILRLIVDCVPNAVLDVALVVGGVERQPRRNLLVNGPLSAPSDSIVLKLPPVTCK